MRRGLPGGEGKSRTLGNCSKTRKKHMKITGSSGAKKKIRNTHSMNVNNVVSMMMMRAGDQLLVLPG